jgi:ERCC4-type nuclease
MINTQLRDGIKVYKTGSIGETADFLRRLKEKLNENREKHDTDPDKYFQAPTDISSGKYASTLKKQKKDNMTPEVWFIAQLSLIPRVTEDVAECILSEYSTMVNLIAEYESTPERDRDGLLANLVYTTKKSGNQHRIGNKMSSCIYRFLYGISDSDE